MGSSAMDATKFCKRITGVRPDITVQHSQVDAIPAECKVAIVQKNLSERTKKAASQVQLVVIDNFLNDTNFDILFDLMQGKSYAEAEKAAEEKHIVRPAPVVIVANSIKLGQKAKTKEEAIKAAGKLIVELGLADQGYLISCLRAKKPSVPIWAWGGVVAIPHDTFEVKEHVKKDGYRICSIQMVLILAEKRCSSCLVSSTLTMNT
ncbi:MAG: PTS sugar transporter subunit IIA [Eggerthellaceae bacterium]|nr:PTS sugar transporter subunit IIA [Eggerthellaceae bacterium]